MSDSYAVPFTLKVVCTDLKTDTVEWEKETNYNDVECRKWLSRTSVWAWTNGKSIETFNMRDADLVDKAAKAA